VAGEAVVTFLKAKKTRTAAPDDIYETEKKRQEELNETVLKGKGGENPFALHRELGEIMQDKVFVERNNEDLDKALEGIRKLRERFANVSLDDTGMKVNQSLSWARQIHDMIVMAEAITKAARMRDECRGSHYKAEFEIKVPEGKFPGSPEYEEYRAKWKASNEKWLKATVASFTAEGPSIDYVPVDISIFPPEAPRDYR
jgi:succinate dehydrogenase / fumarate reductase flavoprotein subunit